MSKAITKARITVEHDSLIIRFSYNKAKFNEIKSLRNASYDKEARCWRLPIETLNKLQQLKSFKPDSANYEFDYDLISRRVNIILEEKEKLRKVIAQNPYGVSLDLIQKADLPIYFCLNKDQPGIVAKIPRYSKLKTKILEIPGSHFLKNDSSYYIPTQYLNIFLKKLKSSKISFAVEEKLSSYLINGVSLRNQALDGVILSQDDLKKTLLMPIISYYTSNSNSYYKLSDWTTEQLRKLIPWVENFKERKEISYKLSAQDILKLLTNAELHNVTVWLDLDSSVKLIKDKIDNNLFLTKSDLIFSVTEKQKAILLVNNKIIDNLSLDLSKEATLEDYSILPNYKTFSINFTRIPEIYELVVNWANKNSLKLFSTENFLNTLKIAKLNQDKLIRQEYYKSLKNTQILSDSSFYNEKLFPHQRVAVAWLLETPRALLGDDMGLGKTLSVLSSYNLLLEKKEIDFLCIVCPFSLVKNWQNEANHWFDNIFIANLPNSSSAQINFFRDFKPNLNAQGLVINFETFRLSRIYSEIEKLANNYRLWLVVDESQRVKNSKSKAFEALASVSKKAHRCTLLSGTPTPKDLTDIWAQMYLLDQGERLGTNFYEWLKDVAELGNKWSDFAVKKFIPEKVKYVKSRVHELLLRRRKEDVVNLPDKLFSYRDIELKGSQFEKYEEVRKELLLRINSLDGTEYIKQINNVMEEFLRAVQIASNPRLVDPSWKGEPAKFLELDEIVNEVIYGQDGKLVIWTNYVNNVIELIERYKEFDARPFYGAISKVERDQTIKCFQNEHKQARILIAVPAAGGVGITLTAARTAVYLDKTWNAEHWLQSIDRIHRIGQTGTVSVISLQACLIDYLISRSLNKKTLAQKDLIDNDETKHLNAYPQFSEIKEALVS